MRNDGPAARRPSAAINMVRAVHSILGSGSLVAALAQGRLLDGVQLVVNPIALGAGRTPFTGVEPPLALGLDRSRAFGNVVLWYSPR